MNFQEHPTSNIQRRTSREREKSCSLRRSTLDVGCWMFSIGSGRSSREISFRRILTLTVSPSEGDASSLFRWNQCWPEANPKSEGSSLPEIQRRSINLNKAVTETRGK